MTTLKDLSRHLGLSVTQVSRALNDHSDVSPQTKERVQLAAKELNYQPNIMARRLVTGRSGIVGLVYPSIPEPSDSWYFTQFVGGLSAHFSRLGRQFMLHIADQERDEIGTYDRLIRSRSIDGFIVVIPEVADARVNFLRDNNVPFVLHGQTMDVPDYPFFDIDNVAVGYELTRHLVQQGHKDIAILNGPEKASYVQRRFVGYRRALAEAGLRHRPEFETSGEMTSSVGLLETIRLFQMEGRRPTGLVAGNMRIAKGIFEALAAMGLSVPGDVTVVAHDDMLPDVGIGSLPVPITTTESALHESWGPLARFLDATLEGAPLDQVQEIGKHRFKDRSTLKPLSIDTKMPEGRPA